MQPIIYYYPERLWDLAITHAKGWGRSYENRTYRTENGDAPCLDVKDSNGDTLYLLIIDDAMYLNCDNRERICEESRYLLLHDAGEYIIMAKDKRHAINQARQYCKDNKHIYKALRYMS